MSYGERHQKCVRFVYPHIFEIFHLKEKKKIGKKIKNREKETIRQTQYGHFSIGNRILRL